MASVWVKMEGMTLRDLAEFGRRERLKPLLDGFCDAHCPDLGVLVLFGNVGVHLPELLADFLSPPL